MPLQGLRARPNPSQAAQAPYAPLRNTQRPPRPPSQSLRVAQPELEAGTDHSQALTSDLLRLDVNTASEINTEPLFWQQSVKIVPMGFLKSFAAEHYCDMRTSPSDRTKAELSAAVDFRASFGTPSGFVTVSSGDCDDTRLLITHTC